MSVQSEITRLSGNVSAALAAIAEKGVTVGSDANSDDLAALIASIEAGGGGGSSLLGHPFAAGSVTNTKESCSQIKNVLTSAEIIDIFGAIPPNGSVLAGWWRADGHYTPSDTVAAFGFGFQASGKNYVYAPAVGIKTSGEFTATNICNVFGVEDSSRDGFYISTKSPYYFEVGVAYNWILVDLSQEV